VPLAYLIAPRDWLLLDNKNLRNGWTASKRCINSLDKIKINQIQKCVMSNAFEVETPSHWLLDAHTPSRSKFQAVGVE
jgi:hypothetical protein